VTAQLLISIALLAPAAPFHAYSVDLQRAILETQAGKRARTELEADRDKTEKRLEKLAKERDREELLAMKSSEEERLRKTEAQRIEEIVTGLRSWLSRAPKGIVLYSKDEALLVAPESCDATEWLIASYDTGKAASFRDRNECRFERSARIDLNQLLQETKEGKAAREKLEEKKSAAQKEIEARERSGAKEAEIDALLEKRQKEIADAESESQRALVSSFQRKLEKAAPKTLFVHRFSEGGPECAAGDWALSVIEGASKPFSCK
jgi:Skp family chaperone for outer membrane proteins